MWNNTINVVLCNPPFGGRSIENRPEVLKHYDLGHRWEYNEREARWEKTEELLPSQQLGILFIERSFKLLANYGRLGIILPEGYLCTSSYGYVRQWIVDNLRLLSLVELPCRIFTASNADLRSNIVIAQKLPKEQLQRLVEADYPIHADIVRKVGYKLGKGFRPTSLRDANTGLEIRDENNRLILDSDFERICGGFDSFIAELRWNPENPEEANNSGWLGARISDVLKHNSLDLKPRRLMPRALRNVEEIKGGEHKRLGDIADVLDHTIDLVEEFGNDAFLRLVEGLHIRAVEGTVVPGLPSRVWRVVSRKSKTAYKLKNKDIIVGLVRPERRNIGLLLDSGDDDLVGATDGIGVVRVKPEYADTYPQEWLFAVLRSESCRIQLWTESGGTSYGKLTREHILDVLLPVPDQKIIEETTRTVSSWANAIQSAVDLWNEVGTSSDRRPIVNSSAFGLVEVDGDEDEDEEDED